MSVPILSTSVDLVSAAATGVEESPPLYSEAGVELVAPELIRLIDASRNLSAAKGKAETALARLLPDDQFAGEGFTLVRRWSAKREEWDDEALVSRLNDAIRRHAMYDQETGVRRLAEAAVEEAVRLFHSVINIKGRTVRMGGLRALGIDPNHYCRTEAAVPTLQVVRS